MSDNYIKNVVEAALLAAGRPLQLTELAQLFDENARPDTAGLRATLEALDAEYSSRGIEVKETASGFRIQVRKEMANEVSRLWPERPPKYSRALLETLALIAYRQPITRGEIEAVRGVAVNPNIIKTVIERNWVHVVGTRDVPGRPELLATTKDFLDYFGLRSLDELPPLAELKAMGDVNLQLDLAKPSEPASDEGSGSSGASGAGEGGSGSAPPSDSSVAAATAAAGELAVGNDASEAASEVAEGLGAVATANTGASSADAMAGTAASSADAIVGNVSVSDPSAATEGLTEVATADTAATTNDTASESITASSDADNFSAADASATSEGLAEFATATDAVAADLHTGDASSAATERLDEVATAATAATTDDATSEPLVALTSDEELVAYEHDPHAATITHVDIESDPGDATVEVEALTFVEQQLEAEERAARDTSIETGEFEMSELGLNAGRPANPAPVIEAEFDAEELSSTQAEVDEDDTADDTDDEEELSAGPQSSTELVAAPRDRDD